MFEEIGGEIAISQIVDDFYRIMQTDPKAKECLATHAGKDILISATKLKYFLSGWLGGPQLYLENFGHPRLRMRHFPYKIGTTEGDQWLYCMGKALELSSLSERHKRQLMDAFENVVRMLTSR